MRVNRKSFDATKNLPNPRSGNAAFKMAQLRQSFANFGKFDRSDLLLHLNTLKSEINNNQMQTYCYHYIKIYGDRN